MSKQLLFVLIVAAFHVPFVLCYHDEGTELMCWDNALAGQPAPEITCPKGLAIVWLQRPDSIQQDSSIHVSFKVSWDNATSYFESDEGKNKLGPLFNSSNCFTNHLCEHLNESHCCFYHVNFHSCDSNVTTFCGPWLGENGDLITHSRTIGGPLDTQFQADLKFNQVSNRSIIAHCKIGKFQFASGIFRQVTAKEPENTAAPTNNDDSSGTLMILSAVLAGAILGAIVIAIIFLVIHRKRRLAKEAARKEEEERKAAKEAKKIRIKSGGGLGTKVSSKFLIPHAELQIIKKIGEGSFGEVWKGKFAGTPVAIKNMKNIGDNAMSSFAEEAALMMSLAPHPNVVLFRGITVDPFHIVTDYCSGGSLAAMLKNQKNRLSDDMILKLLHDIALGMAHLHRKVNQKCVIHRDLATRNILLNHGVGMVSDFGMAKLRKVQNRRSKTLKPTDELLPIKWMAPEAIEKAEYTTKSDVWSYGVVIWEVLTRQTPFKGLSSDEIYERVVQKNEHLAIPDACHPLLKQILELCWQSDPTKRPEFSTFCDMLGEAVEGQSMSRYISSRKLLTSEERADDENEEEEIDAVLYNTSPTNLVERKAIEQEACAYNSEPSSIETAAYESKEMKTEQEEHYSSMAVDEDNSVEHTGSSKGKQVAIAQDVAYNSMPSREEAVGEVEQKKKKHHHHKKKHHRTRKESEAPLTDA